MAATNKNILPGDPAVYRYAEMMRGACPVPGDDWQKFMTVRMLAGDNIKAHKHRYHTVLYYPELAEPVTITPQPGTLLYLPPDTMHEVPVVKRDRLSIAMLIGEPK